MRVSLGLTLVCAVLGISNAFAAPAKKAVVEKEWTFLTFLNGFNNLDRYGYIDLNEMEKVGSSDRVNVLVEWASLRTKEVKRLLVQKDEDPVNVTSPILENLGQADMGDYRTLIESIRWAAKNYPAKHYFVNVWNHGNGWHFSPEPTTRDLSYDDLSGHRITTEQFGQAIAEVSRELGKKIEIVGSDSCLMAMGEVMAEMKNVVSTFIGSEEVEPADGWPYDTFLRKWNEGGEKSATEVAKLLTDVYVESYPNRSATLSGTKMSEYPKLAVALRALGEDIRIQSAPVRALIQAAISRTRSYSQSDYKDLGDLVNELAKDPKIPLRFESLYDVKNALRSFVIANRTTPDYARSKGVAIWFPESSWQYTPRQARYESLVFNQDTRWSDAIAAILNVSAKPATPAH